MLENESKSRFGNETEKSFENKSESRLKGERYAEDMFAWERKRRTRVRKEMKSNERRSIKE